MAFRCRSCSRSSLGSCSCGTSDVQGPNSRADACPGAIYRRSRRASLVCWPRSLSTVPVTWRRYRTPQWLCSGIFKLDPVPSPSPSPSPEPQSPAARGKSLAAFDGRCIPAPPQRGCRVGDPGGGCVAPPSNAGGILSRRALPAGHLARLGATPDFHHGLLADRPFPKVY